MPSVKKKPIYLDYNATTPLDPEVRDAMLPYLAEEFGNPASRSHAYGWEADLAVEAARAQVASLLKCKPQEILFTSGATESNNLTILGLLGSLNRQPCHIITSAIEHKAVLAVCEEAKKRGAEVTVLPVNEFGMVTPKQVEDAIRPNTKLISIMMANNEIGTINPVAKIGELARARGILFHTDAAQTVGKMAIDVGEMKIDFLSISAHKLCGPKGVGAIFVRKADPEIHLEPLMYGGSQERGIRPGTVNVAGVVGLGYACKIAERVMTDECERLKTWQKQIISAVLQAVPNARLNGHPTERLCNNISFSFRDLNADIFALGLSGLALSSGSACTSLSPEPSHVLKAIGHSDSLARSTIRIGIGRFSHETDIDMVVSKILKMAQRGTVAAI